VVTVRVVILGQPWSPDALAGAHNWLQLKIAESPNTSKPAAVLAQAGRTKRIRDTARAAVTRQIGD
jgi:hypothetical protein